MFLATLAFVAMGGFFLGRAYVGFGSADASRSSAPAFASEVTPLPTPSRPDVIDTSRQGWALSYLAADKQLPRFDQVINGIPIGPGVQAPDGGYCIQGQARWAPPDEARALDPSFTLVLTRLPAGAVLAEQAATICGNTVVGHEAAIEIPSAPSASTEISGGKSWFDVAHGGHLSVYKTRLGGPGWTSQIAAERWEAATIDGLPAAIGHAVLKDELGESAVVMWNPGDKIQVIVRGFDVELDTVLSLAKEAVK